MIESRTDLRIGEFVVWSGLAVYAAVWAGGLGLGLGGAWPLAGATAAGYVGRQVFEVTRRNHCYLSADSTALPVSLVVFSLGVAGLWAAGRPPLPNEPLMLPWCLYAAVFLVGHAAALAYSGAVGLALSFVFRKRIAAERRQWATH